MPTDEFTKVQRFDIAPHRVALIILLSVCVAGELLFVYFALTLDESLNLLGIEMTPRQGRIYFGAFALFCLYGVYTVFAEVCRAFSEHRFLDLTNKSVRIPIPRSLRCSAEKYEIPYDVIESVSVRKFGLAQLLQFTFSSGVEGLPNNRKYAQWIYLNGDQLAKLQESLESEQSRSRSPQDADSSSSVAE